jgi:hypothetical protein
MKTSMRWAIVTVAICSWIAISNHCAFAAIAPRGKGFQTASLYRKDADATACPFHSKPAKQKEQSSQVQCCKILRGVVFVQSKVWERDDAKFSDVNFCATTGAFLVHSVPAVTPLLLDTGPPLHPFSFAELVLQQSLLVHAPPSGRSANAIVF